MNNICSVAYQWYPEHTGVSVKVLVDNRFLQNLKIQVLVLSGFIPFCSTYLFLPNKHNNYYKNPRPTCILTSRLPSSGLRKCRGAVGPGAPGPDWFSNKEWTAAPGTSGNCHICHPQKRAEAVSVSSFCDLIGQSYQTVNSGSVATSSGDPYPAPNENEESLRETERH